MQGLATIVAPSIVATQVAASPLIDCSDSDAEIIEAGRAFEAIFVRYLDVTFEWAPLAREAHDKMEAQFPKENDQFQGLGQRHLKWDFKSKLLEENGSTAASDRQSALYQQLEPLADKIRGATTESIGGLRAKTLVTIWDCLPHRARHDGYLDFGDENLWSLLLGTVSLTGLSDFMADLHDRLIADATIFEEDEEAAAA